MQEWATLSNYRVVDESPDEVGVQPSIRVAAERGSILTVLLRADLVRFETERIKLQETATDEPTGTSAELSYFWGWCSRGDISCSEHEDWA